GKNSFEYRLAYQKVAFYRGVEVYNEGNYKEAKGLFEKSMKEAKDATFTARSTFWNAETDYHLSNYNAALIGFKQFQQASESKNTPEHTNLDYNLGYTYFKQKNYTKATEHFNSFISNRKDDKLRLNDAYLRLGDGYFVSSDYQKAITAYEKAIAVNEIETDYAAFQKAMSYGYIGQNTTKIQELSSFIERYKTSAVNDDAMYELANSYVKANQTDKAMAMYDRLNSTHKNSMFSSRALVREGLSDSTSNQNDQALGKFKTVAKDYPSSEAAVQAVVTRRLVDIDLRRVDEYAAWVKTLGYVDVADGDLDTTAYLA